MGKAYKNCQSCGMPLKKDSKGGGTNTDGTKSMMYCSHCFDEGKFLQPNITAAQMQEFVKNKLKEMKFLGFLASFFAKGIPKLERWKNQR
jgi:predicted amidophosphoribosyltransferase